MSAEHESSSDAVGRVFDAELRPSSGLERRWLLGATLAAVTGAKARRVALDRYELGRRLGRGGQGTVWEAHDDRLRRAVAIKVLHTQSDDVVDRLRREARAMARLSHPNVASVFDFGVEACSPYVVMEFVRGESLSAWLARSPAEATVRGVLMAAGRGLAAAHDAGVAHGDFKPSNVMVDPPAVVKVLDFGLARSIVETTGLLGGSAPYMAPEIRKTGVPTLKGDQYAFCAVVCEALTGSLERPLRPEGLLGTHPRWFVRALSRGLSADAGARFASMQALLRALERRPRRWFAWAGAACLAGAAVVARNPAAATECASAETEVSRVWNAERRAELSGTFAAATRQQTDAILGVRAFARTESDLDEHLAAWADAFPNACAPKTSARRDCLQRNLSRVGALLDAWGTAMDVDGVRQAAAAVAALPGVERCAGEPVAVAAAGSQTAALDRAHALRDAGRRAEAIEAAAFAVEATRHAPPALRAEALHVHGQTLRSVDPFAGAAQLDAAMLVATSSGHDRLAAEAGVLLAHTAAAMRSEVMARRAIRATEAASQRYGGDPRIAVGLLGARSELAYNAADYPLALRLATSSLAEAATLDPGLRARVLFSMARTRIRIATPESLAQAVVELGRCLQTETELYGPEHPGVAETQITLGDALLALKDFESAKIRYTDALRILELSAAPHDSSIAALLNNLSLVDVELGAYEQAQSRLVRSLEIRSRTLGDQHPDTAMVRENLGNLARERGDFEGAVEHLQNAVTTYKVALGPEHPWVQETEASLGLAWLEWGHALHAEDDAAGAERAYGHAAVLGDLQTQRDATGQLLLTEPA